MVLRVDVVDHALRDRYGVDPRLGRARRAAERPPRPRARVADGGEPPPGRSGPRLLREPDPLPLPCAFARDRHRRLRGRFFAMSTVIETLERQQLRRTPK